MQGPDDDYNSCEIFGIAGVIVQVVLGVLSFSVLIVKRYRQFPKRPWNIWAMDTSKQGVSQMFAHFINVAISLTLSTHLSTDACIWYFTTNVLDNTLGVFICCGVLRLIEGTIINGRCEQFRSGNYYEIVQQYEEETNSGSYSRSSQLSEYTEPKSLEITTKKKKIIINYFAWFIQFIIWNVIVAVCKSILFTIELLLNSPLNSVSEFLLGWVQPFPTVQLILVIIIIPVFMNGLAFWMQDNFLKKKQEQVPFGQGFGNRQPLI